MREANDVHGKVVSQYGSIAKFADFLGWSYSRTYRIVQKLQEPTRDEMSDILRALQIRDAEEATRLFCLL